MPDTSTILYYSPIIIAVIIFLIQQRIFVTPEQLERKHREILADIEFRYAKLQSFADLKLQVCEITEKIDKIYDMLMQVRVEREIK